MYLKTIIETPSLLNSGDLFVINWNFSKTGVVKTVFAIRFQRRLKKKPVLLKKISGCFSLSPRVYSSSQYFLFSTFNSLAFISPRVFSSSPCHPRTSVPFPHVPLHGEKVMLDHELRVWMEVVVEGLWGLAEYHQKRGEIGKAVKCLKAIC